MTSSTFSYDQAGRLAAEVNSSTGYLNGSGYGTDTMSRSYDAENHTITSSDNNTSTTGESWNLGSITAYNWGPTGHPIQIGSATGTTSAIPGLSSVQYDTLHWDGNQLVFQTNAAGQVDDIKIGTSGDITPLDPSFTGLTFWDRGPGGAVAFCHNAGGTSYVGIISPTATVGLLLCGGSYLQASGSTFTFAGPSSFVWSSAPFSAGPGSNDRRPSYQVGIGQGGLLGMYRTDGMTDGLNTLQGPRTMDSGAGTWTTPDAYAGNVDDPGSQKSYMWNSNNPVAYSDPTGFSADPYSDTLSPPPDTGPPNQNGDADASTASGGASDANKEALDLAQPLTSGIGYQFDASSFGGLAASALADNGSDLAQSLAYQRLAIAGFSNWAFLSLGLLGGIGGEGAFAVGDYAALDYSATTAGSKYLQLTPNMTTSEFAENLSANGYNTYMAADGTTPLMRNGDSLYSFYVRTSNGESGVQHLFSNPTVVNGNVYFGIKFTLNGP